MTRNECFMITIYTFLFALLLKDYSMNIQDLSNLCNSKIGCDHHVKNYKRTIMRTSHLMAFPKKC